MTSPYTSADAAAGASSQMRTMPRAQGDWIEVNVNGCRPNRRGQILKVLDPYGHKRLTVGSGGQRE
jgi:hypothetical protein